MRLKPPSASFSRLCSSSSGLPSDEHIALASAWTLNFKCRSLRRKSSLKLFSQNIRYSGIMCNGHSLTEIFHWCIHVMLGQMTASLKLLQYWRSAAVGEVRILMSTRASSRHCMAKKTSSLVYAFLVRWSAGSAKPCQAQMLACYAPRPAAPQSEKRSGRYSKRSIDW